MKNKVYVADFETSYENNHTWIYAYGLCALYSERVKIGKTLDDFMSWVLNSDSKTVYFHNLKFDGKFILYWLLKHEYTYDDKCSSPNSYTHLIDTMNNYYTIKVAYLYKGKKRTTTFLDSYKKLPFSLAKIAKDFNIEEQKLNYDYDKVRHEGYTLTPEEEEYLRHDVIILRKAMEITEEQGMTKMTIGSNALAFYKKTVDKGDINFKNIFPHIEDEVDDFLRNAYKGGCTILKRGEGNKVHHIYSYDVNSMYPAQLRYQSMPWGMPKYFTGKYKANKKYPLYVQHIKCEFYIRDNKIPCVQIKKSVFFSPNEWLENSAIRVDLYLTNLDLETFLDSYDTIDLEYVDGYMFKAHKGLFNEYIDYWYDVKKNSDNKSMVTIAKLHLNSLYGKFGTAPKKKRLTFQLEDNKIKRKDVIIDDVRTVYLPIAIFVTSYARNFLIKCINANYDSFVYCDTDSIHLKEPAHDIPIDDKMLGYFKFEYSGYGKYLKQKCYLMHFDKEFIKGGVTAKLVCAGLTQSLLEPSDYEFDNFYIGREYRKLKQQNVEGGTYLAEQTHKII